MRRALVLFLVLLLPAPVLAWGRDGHRVVAVLASQRLTPAARAQVEALLADNPNGRSLPAISMWADWVRHEQMPETYNWHFVDIPLSRDTYDSARDCPPTEKGDCVIAAVQRMRDVLADRQRRHRDRVEALQFVVHLVADLHQPLHVAERDHDKGGNLVKVVWFGSAERRTRGRRQAWNLHAVWDDGMIAASDRSASQYAVQLNAWLARQDEKALGAGSVVDWALEGHALARSQVYRDADGRSLPNSGARLGREYQQARIAALDAQLAKAGVRLARVLNEALQ
jgi:hypothetical protein